MHDMKYVNAFLIQRKTLFSTASVILCSRNLMLLWTFKKLSTKAYKRDQVHPSVYILFVKTLNR